MCGWEVKEWNVDDNLFLLMISHQCKLGSIYNIYISSFPSHQKFRHLSKLAKGQNMRDPPCIWIGLMYLDPPCIWIDDWCWQPPWEDAWVCVFEFWEEQWHLCLLQLIMQVQERSFLMFSKTLNWILYLVANMGGLYQMYHLQDNDTL